jgi:hypothetical protein
VGIPIAQVEWMTRAAQGYATKAIRSPIGFGIVVWDGAGNPIGPQAGQWYNDFGR